MNATVSGFAQQDEFLVQIQDSTEEVQLNLLMKAYRKYEYTDGKKALEYVDLAYDLAEKIGDKERMAMCIGRRGVVNWTRGELDSAKMYFDRTLTLCREEGLKKFEAMTLNNVGGLQHNLGNLEASMEAFLEASEIFDELGMRGPQGSIYNNIGSTYLQQRELEPAKKYFRKALAIKELPEKSNIRALALSNMGAAFHSEEQYDSAQYFLKQALEIVDSTGQDPYGVTALNTLGLTYVFQGEPQKGRDYIEQSIFYAQKTGNIEAMARGYLSLAEAESGVENWKTADEHIQKALSILESYPYAHLLLETYEGGEHINERMGNFKQAYSYSEKIRTLSDSLLNDEKQKAITQAQVKFDTELKEKENEILKEKAVFNTQKIYGLLAIVILILIIGALVYFRQRGVIKKEVELKHKARLLHEAEQQLAEQQVITAEMEQQRLFEELEHKSEVVSNLALHIVQKNDLIENLDKQIGTIMGQSAGDKKIREVSMSVKQMLSLEKDREEFQIFIQEGNQAFFKKLDDEFPNLTIKETRLCAMIKLGLTSKEISSILNINTSSVEVSRHRLRKSLGLEKQVNLSEFLAKF